MSDIDDPRAKAYVEHWQRVGPMLEQITREEQRALTPQQHLKAVASVLALARPKQGNGQSSGLIEQQRVFALGRR